MHLNNIIVSQRNTYQGLHTVLEILLRQVKTTKFLKYLWGTHIDIIGIYKESQQGTGESLTQKMATQDRGSQRDAEKSFGQITGYYQDPIFCFGCWVHKWYSNIKNTK